MKKFISYFCIFALLGITKALAEPEYNETPKPQLNAPSWQEIAPEEQKIKYIEPIKRPKWAYPLAWTGYICTALLIPFPVYMKNKDNAIKQNNAKFYEIEKYRLLYENDVQYCQLTYPDNKDLFMCYQNIRNNLYQALGNYSRNNLVREQQNTNNLLKYQILQNNINRFEDRLERNRPKHYHSTIEKRGNYYYTDTYSY